MDGRESLRGTLDDTTTAGSEAVGLTTVADDAVIAVEEFAELEAAVSFWPLLAGAVHSVAGCAV